MGLTAGDFIACPACHRTGRLTPDRQYRTLLLKGSCFSTSFLGNEHRQLLFRSTTTWIVYSFELCSVEGIKSQA